MAEPDVRFRGLRRACSAAVTAMLCAWSFFFGVTCVQGASMEPTLCPGDIVVYRRGGSTAGEGDIILFEKDGWTGGVLHRVVCLEADGSLQTCGDANDTSDREPVKRAGVNGIVVAVVPLGKTWRQVRTGASDVLNSSTNRMMRSDDGEANGTHVPPGMEPHRLERLQGRAEWFTPSAAT
ncbi:MAG: S24/S26 family peptidase [Coriobacteriia bacterium]|nr:S24/S26 family peptidase [Coriobacteriia bacterium]